MITISSSSINFYTCVLVIWLLDSFLNSILAKRMGDDKKNIYFIPFYSYYRFGVLNAIPSVLVIIGLVTSVISTLWLDSKMPLKYTLIFAATSILVNTIIISRSAITLAKSKWRYACISIICGLIGICLEPLILMIIINNYTYSLIFLLLLMQALVTQLTKIILIMTSSKYKESSGNESINT